MTASPPHVGSEFCANCNKALKRHVNQRCLFTPTPFIAMSTDQFIARAPMHPAMNAAWWEMNEDWINYFPLYAFLDDPNYKRHWRNSMCGGPRSPAIEDWEHGVDASTRSNRPMYLSKRFLDLYGFELHIDALVPQT